MSFKCLVKVSDFSSKSLFVLALEKNTLNKTGRHVLTQQHFSSFHRSTVFNGKFNVICLYTQNRNENCLFPETLKAEVNGSKQRNYLKHTQKTGTLISLK